MEQDNQSEPEVQEKPKKKKLPMSTKQREARLENLRKGREARMKKIEMKKKEVQYDVQDSDSDDSIDIDSLVVSKRKVGKGKKQKHKEDEHDEDRDSMKKDLAEMRQMMYQLTKKQTKPRKAGTKIVVLPPTQTKESKPNPEYDSYLQQLSRALGRK